MIHDLLCATNDAARVDVVLQHIALAMDARKHAQDLGGLDSLEDRVRADPYLFRRNDRSGNWHLPGFPGSAGRFQTFSINTLHASSQSKRRSGRRRLVALVGMSPANDVGHLQASAGHGRMLVQVASQFNALEAPTHESLVSVTEYRQDSTQGPRASLGALPGALLRRYAAPRDTGGTFVQETDGPQIEMLGDVLPSSVATVRNGYLRDADVHNPEGLAHVLTKGFRDLRVGVHAGLDVVYGADWSGAVPTPFPRIAQALTSTLCVTSESAPTPGSPFHIACRQLLQAAYLGTLLAAHASGHAEVALTLIGGGVFGNPLPLIWESILWAYDTVDKAALGPLDVVVNGPNLADEVDPDALAADCGARGGFALELAPSFARVVR